VAEEAVRLNNYARLLVMALLSFLSMYVLMYAMVDRFANIYPNLNQIYMAALMTAPMVLIEILLMSAMYKNVTANSVILAASLVALVGCFFLIREQIAVGDRQFLKSMIPHHAGAILMCAEAPIQDTRIRDLCRTIIRGQQSEIDQMKAILRDTDARG
jgi:hypothetical protein